MFLINTQLLLYSQITLVTTVTTATVRNTKMSKTKPRIIINLIADIENAWKLFYDGFTEFVDRHAPLRKHRVKGRNNAWFTPDLSNSLHGRNVAWAKGDQVLIQTSCFSGDCTIHAQLQLEKPKLIISSPKLQTV